MLYWLFLLCFCLWTECETWTSDQLLSVMETSRSEGCFQEEVGPLHVVVFILVRKFSQGARAHPFQGVDTECLAQQRLDRFRGWAPPITFARKLAYVSN